MALIGQGVSEEKMFENVKGRTDGRMDDDDGRRIHGYPISSPVSFGSGELTSSPKGNDRSPDNKQVFLNSSQVSTRFFQLVKGS